MDSSEYPLLLQAHFNVTIRLWPTHGIAMYLAKVKGWLQ